MSRRGEGPQGQETCQHRLVWERGLKVCLARLGGWTLHEGAGDPAPKGPQEACRVVILSFPILHLFPTPSRPPLQEKAEGSRCRLLTRNLFLVRACHVLSCVLSAARPASFRLMIPKRIFQRIHPGLDSKGTGRGLRRIG